MADFEYEYSQTDRQLVVTKSEGTFPSSVGAPEYIRLTIYAKEDLNNIVTLNVDGQPSKAIFYSSLRDIPFEIDITPFSNKTGNIIQRLVGANLESNENDFKIYKNDENIYIKPNEIFNQYGLPQGDYKIQIDFLSQLRNTVDSNVNRPYEFIIKQISPSRKEVRLKLINTTISNNDGIIDNISSVLNFGQEKFLDDGITPNPNYKYQFKHLLNIGTGDHIPIMNYTFDRVTDGKDNQSLILKLYDALPTSITNLSHVSMEREIIDTLIENIFYFSEVPDVFFGSGLTPDPQENWINPTDTIGFQSLEELNISASIGDIEADSLISSSEYGYPNLNTDYRFFENHTFFGSAQKKLDNFEKKVKSIQSLYTKIEKSFVSSGGVITGDSKYLVQRRKDLFQQINDEIKTFTPYERFLYFDGQSESTASAPGLGKNYAESVPINDSQGFVNTAPIDGFKTVYRFSSQNVQNIELFSQKYFVHEKPFYNHSGSIYLSFIMKGDSGSTLSIKNTNNNETLNGLGVPIPLDTKFQTSSLNPTITGSKYQRYIFETSQSHFIPSIRKRDIVTLKKSDFVLNSSNITILSGSEKTGSYKIIDSTGKYPTTVVTKSGAEFRGSVLPSGELFNISIPVTSTVTHSFISDVKVSFKNPANAQPFSNLYHTSSAEWINWFNGTRDSASAFDTDNIHSFTNNLPLYIQESSEYNDLKDFLNLQGEQYDLIKNHVDSLGTLHKRGYKKTNSPPDNTLSILLSNMGWQSVLPFSGSLNETLGGYLNNVTSIDDIKNSTWRKTLNNLIYIYKSKGTKNSVRALLNIYGYPPDVLSIEEFGGSTLDQAGETDDSSLTSPAGSPAANKTTPTIQDTFPINPSDKPVDTDLVRQEGNISFQRKPDILRRYNFANDAKRVLKLDWYSGGNSPDADINTLEFIYKHKKTTQTQTLFKSSGSSILNADASIVVFSDSTSSFDTQTLSITSSDNTKKTYVFDDDNDGATGTLDGSGRVRIQLHGLSTRQQIAAEISKSISSANGHQNKIRVRDGSEFILNDGRSFLTSDGEVFLSNQSSSLVLTQTLGGIAGNKPMSTTAASMSVSGFSGGSDQQILWDLKVKPSSDGISSSFDFRLNNTSHGSSSIDSSSNAVSMSTNFIKFVDGQLWNVMLQRVSSSITGSGVNQYELHAALQDGPRIVDYNFVTMSVSGGLTQDSNFFANENWQSTGSRPILSNNLSNGNLIVGEVFSGSLSEIKAWSTALSKSRFRQHVLNKLSTVGNTINSHREELVYHFKLNENYTTSSLSSSAQNLTIKDSSPKTGFYSTDFSKQIDGNLFTSSLVYGIDSVESIRLTTRDNNSTSKVNSNKILIKPKKNVVGDLNPFKPSIKRITQKNSKPLYNSSIKLELYKSPQTFVNNFILDNISGFDLEKLYANPLNYYSQSYKEFDNFRNTFFDAHPISVDVNEYIRAHENMFNDSIVEAINVITPARSTFGGQNANVGVEIKPTILEKQKYENERHSIQTNPNLLSGSIIFVENTEYKQTSLVSTLETPLTSSLKRGYLPNGIPTIESSDIKPSLSGSRLELPYTALIQISDSGSSHVVTNLTSSIVNPITSSINILQQTKKIFSGSGEILRHDKTHGVNFEGSTIVLPKSGTINYASDLNKSFVNINDEWKSSANRGLNFPNYANEVTPTKTSASISFTFFSSSAHNSSITLTSFNGLNEISKSFLVTTSSAVNNGDLTADSSSILFLTGSSGAVGVTGSQASNFLAALTSSNGFANVSTGKALLSIGALGVARTNGTVTLTQPFAGLLPKNFSASFSNTMTSSISQSSTLIFRGGSIGRNEDDFNVNHIDTRYKFYSIGDNEYYSASKGHSSKFEDYRRFYNRQIVSDDFHSSVTYESLINGTIGGQTGRMMGKTRYFLTSSNGDINLPRNHVTNFSQPFKEQMINGTQNINPGILDTRYEDYSSASFYRVKVTGGGNQIQVQSGNPQKGGDDRIIY